MDEFEHIGEILKQPRLSGEEKNAIRSQVKAFMQDHPARAPFSVRVLDVFSAIAMRLSFVHAFRFRYVSVTALALVLAIGVGTSYAAEDALPGDPLYGIKVNVNEPLQGALATTPSAQAQWNTDLATRRLEEAEALVAEGKLSATDEQQLAGGFEQASNGFDVALSALSVSSSSAAAVADAQSSMQATLEVHADVLNQLASTAQEHGSSVASLISRVRTRAIGLSHQSAGVDQTIAESGGTSVKAAAEVDSKDAQGQLSQARALVGSASSSAPATSETVVAQEQIGAGDASLNAGEYGVAFAQFQSALLDAKKAQIRVDAIDTLKNTTGISLPASTSTYESIPSSAATSSAATSTQSDSNDLETDTGL